MKSNSSLGYFPIIPNGFNTPPLCGVIVLGHELCISGKVKMYPSGLPFCVVR